MISEIRTDFTKQLLYKTMKILVIEDEPKAAAFLRQGLEEQHHQVDIAYDGQMGKRLALMGEHDIIILDIIIPYINGLELAKEIRKTSNVPILMLTALGSTADKVTGFDSGADDYLVKPFEFAELVARVNALAKRKNNMMMPTNKLTVGDLVLNLDDKTVSRGGKKISLTTKEYQLLEYLIRNKERVVTRNDIAKSVWDVQFDSGTNVIDVYVNFLRKKIDKDYATKYIHTQIGMGYIFREPDANT